VIEPRKYQLDAIAAFMANLDRGIRRQLIVLPTGTGKTLTALLLARHLGGPVLWLAHRDELVQQPFKAAKTVLPDVECGVVKAARNEWRRDLVFASIQTAFREKRLEQLRRREWKLVVIDECHHAPSASWKKVVSGLGCLEDSGGPPLLGLTATTERLDSARLDDIFQQVAYQYHLNQAIKDGFLVRPDIVFEPIQVNLDSVHSRRGDFDPKELDLALLEGGIIDAITNAVKAHAEGRKTLIFTVSVRQAQMVADALKAEGLAAGSVDGKMHVDERRYALRKFARGDTQIMANCAILTEGFDEPSISCIILARPTQSKSLLIQCVGRGLRLAPNKQDCKIVDMVAITGRHSLVQAPVIFGAEIEAEAHEASQEALFKVDPAEYWRQRLSTQVMGLQSISRSDMNWIRGAAGELLLGVGNFGTVRLRPDEEHGDWRIEVIGNRETGRDLEPLAEGTVEIELGQGLGEDYVRRCKAVVLARGGRWRDQPATPAQLEALRRWNIDPPPGLTKGQASEMLTAAAARRYEPATHKQIAYLRRLRVKFDKGITKKEAGRLIGASRT
jgi:superfamily II DNA or RNA helicase